MKQIISTEKAPKAIGPYSQAVKANGFVFTSGQLPINPATGAFREGGIAEQTAQVLENVRAVLQAAGTDMQYVVKMTVFLKDINDFKAFNEVYATFFPENPPARSAFQVAALPLNAMIEIEAVAVAL